MIVGIEDGPQLLFEPRDSPREVVRSNGAHDGRKKRRRGQRESPVQDQRWYVHTPYVHLFDWVLLQLVDERFREEHDVVSHHDHIEYRQADDGEHVHGCSLSLTSQAENASA